MFSLSSLLKIVYFVISVLEVKIFHKPQLCHQRRCLHKPDRSVLQSLSLPTFHDVTSNENCFETITYEMSNIASLSKS